jgi:hypothetical protein
VASTTLACSLVKRRASIQDVLIEVRMTLGRRHEPDRTVTMHVVIPTHQSGDPVACCGQGVKRRSRGSSCRRCPDRRSGIDDPVLLRQRVHVHAVHHADPFDQAVSVTAVLAPDQFDLAREIFVDDRVVERRRRNNAAQRMTTLWLGIQVSHGLVSEPLTQAGSFTCVV